MKLFERLCWVAGIIALLILLKHCGNRGISTVQALTDSLRIRDKAARDTANLHQFRYSLDSAHAATATKQAQDSSASAWATAGRLQQQIRALMGRKTAPTAAADHGYVDTASPCCPVALQLADQVDTLRVRDSTKDAAFNTQLTIASNMVNAQSVLLDEAHDRFNRLDSVYMAREEANRPRGSVWLGVKGAVGPVNSAGIYTKYQKKNKEYGVGVSVQPTGIVYEGMIGIKISFRKKR